MRSSSTLRSAVVVAVVSMALLTNGSASAHAVLVSPKPRNNTAQKFAPCGNTNVRGVPTVLTSGAKLNVTYTEQVDHPGYYQVWFSPANDANFVILADQIPNPAGRQNGSREITLPDQECETCTLRLIQVMTEQTDPALQNYYSCADIALRRSPANPDGGTQPPDTQPDAGTGASTDGGTIPADPGLPATGSDNGSGGENSLTPEQEVSAVSGAGDVRAGCSASDGALSSAATMLTALFLSRGAARRRIRRQGR